jgi:hypothetical protein
MHAASTRPKTLTASITAKVTADEEKLFRGLAQKAGLSPSEWCRRMLINAASCPRETRLVVEEIAAVRSIVSALFGVYVGQEKWAMVNQASREADGRKAAKAEKAIKAFFHRQKSEIPGVSPESREAGNP